MKKSIDIHHDVLNDSQRPYFGLDPIDSKWDAVEIKPGFTVFYDGHVIRKVISFLPYRAFDEYREYDTELLTRDRQWVLPKTGKGKEKKLNFTSVNSFTPMGVEINLKVGSYHSLWVGNARNAISLPLQGETLPKTLEEFQAWRDAYIADSPSNHFEKVDRMRNLPHRTIKYFNGDLFRFEIDREHYGFGIIIGQIRQMQKDGIIPERHALKDTMTVPLLVRFYRIKTKDHDIGTEAIVSSPLLPAEIMGDGVVIWGSVDIIGSKRLEANDIDFPVQVGRSISSEKYFRFCWGLGMIVTDHLDGAPVLSSPKHTYINRFLNNGVCTGVDASMVERAMRGESPLYAHDDICHPGNAAYKEAVFRFLQLPSDLSFDEFNAKYDGLTRQQYADYANEYLRNEKTIALPKKGRSAKKKG